MRVRPATTPIAGRADRRLGLVPLVLIAWLFTAATLPLSRLALTATALLAAGVPLFALGISIGYSLSTKAALAVAQSLLLPLAFADLVVTATTGAALPGTALVMLAGWTVLTGSLAVWAYRRDEGRRFR